MIHINNRNGINGAMKPLAMVVAENELIVFCTILKVYVLRFFGADIVLIIWFAVCFDVLYSQACTRYAAPNNSRNRDDKYYNKSIMIMSGYEHKYMWSDSRRERGRESRDACQNMRTKNYCTPSECQ